MKEDGRGGLIIVRIRILLSSGRGDFKIDQLLVRVREGKKMLPEGKLNFVFRVIRKEGVVR
jgi:hypothetical protein